MQNKIDKLIKSVYKKWKLSLPGTPGSHPDEEALSCFLEDKLPQEESELIKQHLSGCEACAEYIAASLKVLETKEAIAVPQDLVDTARNLVDAVDKSKVLEIFLRCKNRIFEVLSSSGDVLVGQELVPAPLLRSRNKEVFQDQITILKDFKDIRIEVKIENKNGKFFTMIVMAKDKIAHKMLKDLRVTLIREDVELESYLSDSGKVAFENVQIGKYRIDISGITEKLASILVDIKL